MGAVHTGMSRQQTFAGYSTLETEICTCGVLFAAPEHLLDKRREDGQTFYCPNGHRLVYDSENERLRRQLDSERARSGRLAAERDQIEASRRAIKGQNTKIKNRIGNGVCPCCNRTFKDLAQHMKTQHPTYVKDAA